MKCPICGTRLSPHSPNCPGCGYRMPASLSTQPAVPSRRNARPRRGCLPGLLRALVLTFLESWSAIEQPMTFLRDEVYWPLSLVIPNVLGADVAYAMGASFVALVPAIVIFRFGQKYLELGIQSSGLVQ